MTIIAHRNARLFLVTLLGLVFALGVIPALAQAGPKITISEPQDGATIQGSSVTLKWSAEGVTIKPAKDATAKEEGHFHVLLDKDTVAAGTPFPQGDPAIVHTANTEQTFDHLTAGNHTVTIVLGYSDHTPWQPPVEAKVSFTIATGGQAPPQLPKTGGATPNDLALVGMAVVCLLLGSAVWLRRRAALH
jgi:LPXTG-motif cell wall-anchored protein